MPCALKHIRYNHVFLMLLQEFSLHHFLLTLLLSFTLLVTGCASKASFAHTPVQPSEFDHNKTALDNVYADIPTYEERFRLNPASHPAAEGLQTLWGAPQEVDPHWTEYVATHALNIGLAVLLSVEFLIPLTFLILPTPPETHTWNKGNYTIDAHVSKTLITGYDDRMSYWEWSEIEESNATKE